MNRPLKWICALLLVIPAAGIFWGCSKDKGLTPDALVGRWQYQNSTYDTSATGKSAPPVTIYDASFAADVGETLEFKKGDTVYYSYQGVTTWSNYAVKGHQLILIGSAFSDTLMIYALNANLLTIGWEKPTYKAHFSRQ
ncbi:hypothetical protein Q4E93_33150 [Flavitalea sp. BT771]|uniref:hypothetical protein n=1 Tax=Flavitalea sp. BT771 TaxID=3063329 RepID=UPI0026E364E0|nr:hypothetical protein [Flavitalea sp. BT771]MDO6435509.1 hypothetical protein [Flavitalea sp. BT771]MDV6224409.1 hypothetical protein [Flavitalea sp. BT771]